jgi:hypothetical protein
MGIAKASPASLHQNMLLVMLGDLEKKIVCFRLTGNRAQRYLNHHILPFGSGTVCPLPVIPMARKDMLAVPDMQQSPELTVSAQDDVPASAAVTSVRPSFGYEFFPPKVGRSFASPTRPAKYLNIVYKI